jgi:hypothetical protein
MSKTAFEVGYGKCNDSDRAQGLARNCNCVNPVVWWLIIGDARRCNKQAHRLACFCQGCGGFSAPGLAKELPSNAVFFFARTHAWRTDTSQPPNPQPEPLGGHSAHSSRTTANPHAPLPCDLSGSATQSQASQRLLFQALIRASDLPSDRGPRGLGSFVRQGAIVVQKHAPCRHIGPITTLCCPSRLK